MEDEDFEVKTDLEYLIGEAKDLKRSLECLILLENPSAFHSKQKLVSQCQFLSERLCRFVDLYEKE